MNNEQIRELTTKEVKEIIEEERMNLTKLKLAHVVSPLDNPHKLSNLRKTIARLKTELRSRQLKEAGND